MMDVDCWATVEEILSVVDHNKRHHATSAELFGELHVGLFGDFKQLPPAVSRPPFIVAPWAHEGFDFRVLRQNRRVVHDASRAEQLANFHQVLTDISEGIASNDVRKFVIDCYVRGAASACAAQAPVEGSTAIFTKRRYRDGWNRTVARSLAMRHESLP